MAEENQFSVDKDGFARMMEEQRQRAKSAHKSENAFARDQLFAELLQEVAPSSFGGYTRFTDESQVLAIFQDDQRVDFAADADIIVVTASTPFYAESGGEVADTGAITAAGGAPGGHGCAKDRRLDFTFWEPAGSLRQGDQVQMELDSARRLDISRNHTATHLLHQALRMTLGEHAQQKGSLVEAERLRFDFSHLSALSEEELARIENIVNQAILAMYPVATHATSLEQARDMGATALFGEKYGDEVRVVEVAGFSMELCGGAHVSNTGQIGLFKIVSEGSVGSGLRRIEAMTGRAALQYLNQCENQLKSAAAQLRTVPAEVPGRIESLMQQLKEKDKEIEAFKAKLSKASVDEIIAQAYAYNGVNILVTATDSTDANHLRQNAERLKDKLAPAVVILAAVVDEKVALAGFAGKEVVARGIHIGKIIGAAAKVTGGGGGGRPDMAQAGGREIAKIEEALATAKKMVENSLA
jgi:alanyl-tRNA synthetase